MPQALPVIGTIVGGVASSFLSSRATSASNDLIKQQMNLQQQQMNAQLEQTRSEQARYDEMLRYQQETDAARRKRAEASYLTEGGGAEGESPTLGKRTILGM